MDFRRWITDMRTRTALVLFVTSMLVGGMIVFALAEIADGSERSSKAKRAKSTRGSVEDSLSFRWREFGAALLEAKEAGKPIVVDVFTDWCGWCRRMDRDTYSSQDVRSYLQQAFVPVKLNAEAGSRVTYKGDEYSYRQIASGFRVTSYPTTLFLDADGSYIVAAPGYMRPPDFLTVLRYIGDGHYKKKTFDEYKDEIEQAAESDTSGK